ncbi:Dockerin type I repeat protein [Rubripirellula lacrimiformis]|uniref:Dockerin type I repeat protein n=1 Tax=Rubripirellula lacrimiformis TaxID=1930273 RepID=A0A517N641_9BACT|nr:GEVED domain-containing protein [Rubripirellula lacrimiformis]QDT02610.1 Dockerin type I repeat protein [Rubripirellula lacrimiformis]
MTLRDSLARTGNRMIASDNGDDQSIRNAKNQVGRLRQKRRRKDRRLLSESLEQRQLLAGPDLIGIQPNIGSLLNDGTELNVSPRELVFRFDDNADIDPSTLSAIRITRAGEDGVFESASTTSDLGTNGAALVEFRAVQTGSLGNGLQLIFTSSSRTGSSLPIISVSDQVVSVNVNSNPNQPTRMGDLISALNNNAASSSLIEAIQVSGASQTSVAGVPNNLTLTLVGANSAEAVTDFGTNGAVRVRLVSQLPGVDGLGTQVMVERRDFGGQANPVVVVTGQEIRVQLNSNSQFPSTTADFINAINANPDSSALVLAVLQEGNVSTVIGAGTTPLPNLSLSGVTDVVVEPGYVGLGDSPREVVFRFAEPLPDDSYQIDILGTGSVALRNADGELFQDGEDLTRRFQINLGPKVVAVVPEPVRRNAITGALTPDVGKIEVHFNEDDLNKASAENASFYQLVFTRDTASNLDDVIVPLTNKPVYNSITNIVTLDYGRPLSRLPDTANPGQFLTGAARLRVGTSEGLAVAPTVIPLVAGVDEAGATFDSAFNLDSQWSVSGTTTSSARLSGEIFNSTPFDLTLPGPDLPGTRQIRPDDPSRLTRTVPLDYLRNGADTVDGISVIQYDFVSSYLGDDPTSPGINEDKTYFNIISEQQKQRVREVMQLYSEYLGISFVEVEGGPTSQASISIAVGDLYGTVTTLDNAGTVSEQGGLAVATRDRNGDGIADLGVMDFQDFDESTDDQFGGEFFRGGMFVVGQLLGYGYADDLPQPVTQSTSFIFAPGTDNEPAFPSVADIVHGQYLYRPDSTDIDLYKFTLASRGSLSIEAFAERLADPSLLDTTLRLYRLGDDGSYVEIAQNDDYFSNDSAIDIDNLSAGSYMVGVSARGNNDYDPSIENSGFGGLTEGEYELALKFTPAATSGIRDAGVGSTSQVLDGDGDNRAGGVFDFWFVPNDSNNTLYVDKAASATSGATGTVGSPYREIDQAIAAARPGDTIRVVGNGGVDGRIETVQDNYAYKVGFSSNGLPLEDGSSLNLPKDVRMIIDSGAILKLSGARIGVGSVSPLIDASNSSLQVLGTPTLIGSNGLPARDATNSLIPGSVYFTSLNDSSIGMGASTTTGPAARPGDWGGIDFRGDLDSADESRRNREEEGVFLNHIQFADMRYGGGAVSVGGLQVPISPVDMAVTRATIINSRISDSSDAAIAATPDTFAETRFTESKYQSGGAFTPDVSRVGPEIHGNVVIDNSINGLFVRVGTRTGDVVEKVTQAARFDDTDITHILTENLIIQGTPGGPLLQSSAPSSLLVRLQSTTTGNVPAATYAYRITNVDSQGLESASSQTTVSVTTTATGGIALTQLPTTGAGSDFVSRRLYRASVDPITGLPGEFRLVKQLNASDTSATDTAAAGTTLLSTATQVLRSRLDASLVIDPGTVVKIDGARIEARFGGNLIAEGSASLPVVFTSLEDQRYGAGGTFDTNDRGDSGELNPGDWGGIYIGAASSANIDQAVIAGAGGTTRVEGGFASFNAIEVQQGQLRLANTRLEQNADGRGQLNGDREGRSDNASATVFVRAAAPTIINNLFIDNEASALSFDINSLSSVEVNDAGRASGLIDSSEVVGNYGPLVQGNVLSNNAINGMVVRGGQLATAGVWDDIDIVHVVTDSIEIPNQHIYGGLRLQSDARGSLVVKFQSAAGETAGIVVGGSLATASDQFRDIADRIGGSLQVVGHPDFPVILTALADDTAGAGFTPSGFAQMDTNNDGISGVDLSNQDGRLPTGPEVDQGTLIDNDVDPTIAGSFSYQPGPGGQVQTATTSVQGLTQLFQSQFSLFDYGNFIDVGADGAAIGLGTTTVTQQPTLIGDDRVASEGNFQGANGLVNWRIEQYFNDGGVDLVSEISFTSDTPLGDIRFINYYDPVIGTDAGDVLFTEGTPGTNDFRVTILDGPEEIGFRQYGVFEPGPGLQGATYEGWIADDFPILITAPEFNLAFTPAGTVNAANVPVLNDPRFPAPNYGPGILTSAMGWLVDPNATSATITTNLQVIAEVFGTQPNQVESGLWNGIVIREAASDRNVSAIAEQEPVRSGFIDSNSIPSQSQFLGELAPNEQSGDENRRLGFSVAGAVTEKSDLDVYSFVGQSGTEVWFDIDRTGAQLDSVVELIDANGRVLASSNDSLLAETNPLALFTATGVNPDAAQPLSVVSERLEAQQIRISESIVDATSGNLALSIAGVSSPVLVSLESFLQDPAAAIGGALETAYPTQLGEISATLLRRAPRTVDPNNPSVITRPGDDFVIQLVFDGSKFAGRQVPAISVTTPLVVGATVTASVDSVLLNSQLQDAYSSNSKDAGMRIILPGEAGTRNLYHIRVRSSNTVNPLDFNALNDPNNVKGGLSTGSYELQIRLQEADEHAGTQMRLADVRYAVDGLQIIGQPLHSPLLGEDYEVAGDNDSSATAQPLGYYGAGSVGEAGPLQSDRLAKSFAGELSSATDVDWYSFDINYENLTRGPNDPPLYLSTVFDLDYADGFARADMAIYVFNSAGELIFVGGDSNIADDLPGVASGNNTDDLSRGSAGTLDPYIGAAELVEGSYFIAVANQGSVPLPIDQFFNPNSANPLLRLEPIDSVTRIAEDRIYRSTPLGMVDDTGNFGIDNTGQAFLLSSSGTTLINQQPITRSNGTTIAAGTLLAINSSTGGLLLDAQGDPIVVGNAGGGTASAPTVPVLFDGNSIVPNTFDDALLYVNTANGLMLVNPFTGASYGTVGTFGDEIRDIAFRSNGELFGYSDNGNPAIGDDSWFYHRIDTGTATLSAPLSVGAGIDTYNDLVGDLILEQASDDGLEVEAITIREFQGSEIGYFVGNRPVNRQGLSYFTNMLYRFDEETGLATGPPFDLNEADAGAGTTPRENGQINTAPLAANGNRLGITAATEFNAAGVNVASLVDGDTFVVSNGAERVTFELDQSFTFTPNSGVPVRDGDTFTIDGVTFEFDSGQRVVLDNVSPAGTLTAGSTVRVTGANGQVKTFQFVRLGQASTGNVPVSLVTAQGASRTTAQIASSLASAINANISGAGALASNGEVFFTGTNDVTLTSGGSGVSVAGGSGTTVGNIPVTVSDNAGPEQLIAAMAEAIREAGISVSSKGTQLSLPAATVASVGVSSPVTLTGSPGVTSGNIAILLLPTDDPDTLAQRISLAVEDASDSNALPNVSAVPDGRSILFEGGIVEAASGNLTAGGVAPVGNAPEGGGIVTGIELVNNVLYAVTDNGGLFRVESAELNSFGNRQIGSYVSTATDLVGLNFTGLRAGPVTSVGADGQALSNLLFGITASGDLYAFNTRGELQPIFAGGRTSINTGIGGALGLDFGVVDYNLWHVTGTRGNDAGHGINALDGGTRAGTVGGSSLVFNYETNAFAGNYPSLAEQPVIRDANGGIVNPRQDGASFDRTYNVPGGAKGVVQSNPFSLDGVASADQPTMYFNYFADTPDETDRLRVFVVTADGVEHLVASNSLARGTGLADDEFDDPSTGIYDDDIDVDVQQLFNATDTWRQARVPLGEFAGQDGLSLRIEFSTSGTSRTSSQSLRVTAGDLLLEGQTLVVNGETFGIDLASAVSTPSGNDLAAFYADPAARATVTIDGQVYVLNDGVRTVTADEISVPLTLPVSSLTSDQIAASLAEAIRVTPPAGPVVNGVNLSDGSDTSPTDVSRNDLIFEATPLPYNGGAMTINGVGRLGNVDGTGVPTNIEDVDLLQLDVTAGTTISVDVDLDFDPNLNAAIRFFDSSGNALDSQVINNTVRDTVEYTAAFDGTVYIGISGRGNETYDIRVPGTTQTGQIDSYIATIEVTPALSVQTQGNLVETVGLQSISASPASLFSVSGQSGIEGIPVRISRFMSPAEVAGEVQRVIADQFFDGNVGAIPVSGATLQLASLSVNDSGPFVSATDRYADGSLAGVIDGTRNNESEGIYLDDFVIGFAERGEIATSSNVVDSAFVTDTRSQFPNPDDPVSALNTGSYQVEIRSASEYINSALEIAPANPGNLLKHFRTFDTNDRLSDSRTIQALSADQLRDGLTFSINDGRSTVTFEFNQTESAGGVTPGRVEVPFTLEMIQPGTEEIDPVTGLVIPGTGTLRPQTASEVAANIIAAINRADVQSILDVPALSAAGVDGGSSSVINLFGEVVVDNQSGALASVTHTQLSGDDNRDRDGQGIILIESSRFLYNQEHGIKISHGLTANVDGTDTPSIVRYPRNLVELNSQSLTPGVIIQSNILAFNDLGGLQIDGIGIGANDTASDPVAFDRIVNNTIIGGDIRAGFESPPQTFSGTLFPQGVISFADTVVSYVPDLGGNPPATVYRDPSQALGAPDGNGRGPEPVDGQSTVSLGAGGSLTLGFRDNLLTGSGDSRPDLIVYETGAIESVRVEISRDGIQFELLGQLGGLTNQIDIDALGYGTQDRFAFVRLTDMRQGDTTGAALGADIDAVGAISTVPVERFTAGGTGIELVGNAAPVLLNNVIANTVDAITLDPTNTLPVLGGNTYYRNTSNVPTGVSIGQFAQQIADSEVIFVGASDLIFAPAAGARIIDSSIDSLEDRSSLTAVKNPLGLPPSPILAPRLDVNGQLRIDDPAVETPSGLGERVFKDRGASDRGDLVGPRVVLLSPQAPSLGLNSGNVSVFGDNVPRFFEIQLIDGIAPADVTPGTGIDDRSVSNQSVLLLKDNVALVEGVDYRFGYNPTTNVIRLTPIAGVWEPNSTYVIRMIDSSDAIVAASNGVSYVDGGVLSVRDLAGGSTDFEYESGIRLRIPTGTIENGAGDGVEFEVFDGVNTITFELDDDGLSDTANVAVAIPLAGNDSQIAEALAAAVNDSILNLTANTNANIVQFLGSNPLSSVTADNNTYAISGAIGTQIGFGLQVPFDGSAVADSMEDGQTFVIRRGADTEVVFEFDSNGSLENEDAKGVTISAGASLDQIADAIVRAVGGAGLGLSPMNAGFGRVFLGGDANYSFDAADSVLTQLGIPGQDATLPIIIPIDQTDDQIAGIIAAAINAAGLPGVTTSVVDSRIFVEGTAGISGVGSVDTVTIRDEVGNLLQSNQSNGRTELTIFVGGGFDYGDAPAPYLTLDVDGGPRHAVDNTLTLGSAISADSDGKLPNGDDDDGVQIGSVRGGFATNVSVSINNTDANRTNFYLDAWFDWNDNGVFEISEVQRFGSVGTGRSVVGVGVNNLSIDVPAGASVGEIYARFRLSDQDNLGSTGDASAGEVEDYSVLVSNNPFQNPASRYDVNASGVVTPLDALQIINAIDRYGSQSIPLDVLPLPINLPQFPDVNGDGRVSAFDALQVINQLSRLPNTTGGSGELVGEGELAGYSAVASGVLASGATLVGDEMISRATVEPDVAAVDPAVTKTSVFDNPAVSQLDSIVDALAEDTHASRSTGDEDPISALDQLFASL